MQWGQEEALVGAMRSVGEMDALVGEWGSVGVVRRERQVDLVVMLERGAVGEGEGYKGMAVWIESSSEIGKGFGKLAVVAAMASGRGRWGSWGG